MKIVSRFLDGTVIETSNRFEEIGVVETALWKGKECVGYVLTTHEDYASGPSREQLAEALGESLGKAFADSLSITGRSFASSAMIGRYSRAEGNYPPAVHKPHRRGKFSRPESGGALEADFFRYHNAHVRKAMEKNGVSPENLQGVEVFVGMGETCPAEYAELAKKSPELASITYLE